MWCHCAYNLINCLSIGPGYCLLTYQSNTNVNISALWNGSTLKKIGSQKKRYDWILLLARLNEWNYLKRGFYYVLSCDMSVF